MARVTVTDINTGAKTTALRAKYGIAAIALCFAGSVAAEGMKHSDGSVAEIGAMLPGDQRVLTNHSATFAFAGRSITLSDFTGLLGYASDAAYIVTTGGSASVSGAVATRGRMVILPPFGEQATVVRFDARRLAETKQQNENGASATFYSGLESIAKAQSRGVFLGSLGRTNFNIAAAGLAKQEMARRSIVGGSAVQDIRFSARGDKADYEKAVVTRFLVALASEDSATAAQLMDPLPFGLSDMRGAPGDARSVAAEHLIYERNWRQALGQATPEYDASRGVWTLAGSKPVTITLRSSQDIPFIKSIRIGE